MTFNKQGFIQAIEVLAYCVLVALFIGNAEKVFGKMNDVTGPILLLLLFSTSVMICGAIVFLKPYKLFMADKKKEALDTIISTIFWLIILVIVCFTALFLAK